MRRQQTGKVSTLHRNILRWYREHQRELQWRTTRDPYAILVSEIMLQQTQVSRVKIKLPLFLKQFPTIYKLAHSPKADVIRAWKGMGYNNRAVRLREMARIVTEEYRGRLPTDVETLKQLPGVGEYTSHAVLCFAYGKRVPVVDVNIHRVLSRIFARMKSVQEAKHNRDIWSLAGEILPNNSYLWNQALMDLGATICIARRPKCELCPVKSICASHRTLRYVGEGTLNRKLPKRKTEPRYHGVPHRIWRGRIVEVLRTVDGNRSISLRKIGSEIKSDFKQNELPWLRTLVDALVNDGIASTRGNHATLKVRLAS